MAVAFGIAGSESAGSTAVTPGIPSSTAAGNALFLFVENKYPTNGPVTPSGWTLLAQYSGGSGANGLDSGNVYMTVFKRIADGTESGTVSVSIPNGNSTRARILRYTKASDKNWDIAIAGGSEGTPGSPFAITYDVDPGITVGDLCLVANAFNSDGAGSWSFMSLTTPGVTYGATTSRTNGTTTNGDDSGYLITEHPISSGTSTGVSSYSATHSAVGGELVTGASVLIRLREVDASAQNVDPSGIASGESFGTANVGLAVDTSGIASQEAFGTPSIEHVVAASSIGSAEAFGAGSVTANQILSPTSIASGESFGAPVVNLTVQLAGIVSAETVGQPGLVLVVAPSGVASLEAFGTAILEGGASAVQASVQIAHVQGVLVVTIEVESVLKPTVEVAGTLRDTIDSV